MPMTLRSRRRCSVGGANRIAVHGGGGEGRLGAPRRQIGGEHAAGRFRQRHRLGRKRRDAGDDARDRVVDGEEAHFAGAFQVARPAAALLDEADVGDRHAAVDGLGHVVDGEAGDRDGGQRLHLDAGLAGDLGRGADAKAGEVVVGVDVDGDLGERQRVAERDQLVGALGRHDAGDARGADHVALLGVAGADQRRASPAP